MEKEQQQQPSNDQQMADVGWLERLDEMMREQYEWPDVDGDEDMKDVVVRDEKQPTAEKGTN